MTRSPTVVKTSTGITASPTAPRSISPSKPSSRNSSPASPRPSSLANLSTSSLSRSLQPSTVSTASPSQSRTHYDLSPSRPLVVYLTETATYYSTPSAGIVERNEITQEVIYGENDFEGQNLGTGNVGESTYDSNCEGQGQELVNSGDVDEGRPSSGNYVVGRRELNTPNESQRLLLTEQALYRDNPVLGVQVAIKLAGVEEMIAKKVLRGEDQDKLSITQWRRLCITFVILSFLEMKMSLKFVFPHML
ncbi:1356_t:CDS:2 [Acaulospora morrowiae]|uniref:1356_t:CDS:1 n=1 Tax=Acaulospora morrowiae TaxID=94023 RepID=A0A9N9ANX6_9GLOM|nr:1356_t:CDS:2 [Acaulospora morrowiae]